MLILDFDLLPLRDDGVPRRLDPEMLPDISIYEQFRENDDEINARIPEVVWNFLGHAGEADDKTRTDYARELVFAHLYGRFDLQFMKMHQEGFYFRSARRRVDLPEFYDLSYSGMAEARAVGKVPQPRLLLGNNLKQLRLAMPRRMADDVRHLAVALDRMAPQVLREILVRELFGRRFAVNARGV